MTEVLDQNRTQIGYQTLEADQALDYIFSAYEQDRPYTLFDTRDAESFARGHLPGAQPLVERDLGQWIGRLPRSQPVLIYCYHGNASQNYAQMFADFGYTEVYSIAGGFHALAHAWQRAHAAATAKPTQASCNAALSPPLAEFLADSGFPPNDLYALIANETTSLMRAARLGRLDLVDELIELGAPLDAHNADGNTALWLACFSGNLALIRRLLAAGAAIDNQNENGATCLMYAASNGKVEIVKLLLAHGADAKLPNLDDFRAVDLAATIECLELLRHTA